MIAVVLATAAATLVLVAVAAAGAVRHAMAGTVVMCAWPARGFSAGGLVVRARRLGQCHRGRDPGRHHDGQHRTYGHRPEPEVFVFQARSLLRIAHSRFDRRSVNARHRSAYGLLPPLLTARCFSGSVAPMEAGGAPFFLSAAVEEDVLTRRARGGLTFSAEGRARPQHGSSTNETPTFRFPALERLGSSGHTSGSVPEHHALEPQSRTQVSILTCV